MIVVPPVKPESALPVMKKRRISREAGIALEILGHAIQYLIDEHLHEGSLLKYEDAHVEALTVLKALNRQIYFECPETQRFRERCYALLYNRFIKAK